MKKWRVVLLSVSGLVFLLGGKFLSVAPVDDLCVVVDGQLVSAEPATDNPSLRLVLKYYDADTGNLTTLAAVINRLLGPVRPELALDKLELLTLTPSPILRADGSVDELWSVAGRVAETSYWFDLKVDHNYFYLTYYRYGQQPQKEIMRFRVLQAVQSEEIVGDQAPRPPPGPGEKYGVQFIDGGPGICTCTSGFTACSETDCEEMKSCGNGKSCGFN